MRRIWLLVGLLLVGCGATANLQATQTRTSEIVEMSVVARVASTPTLIPAVTPVPDSTTQATLSASSDNGTNNGVISSDNDIWQRVWTFDKAAEYFVDRQTGIPPNTGRGITIPNSRALPSDGILKKLDMLDTSVDALSGMHMPERMHSLQGKVPMLVAAMHKYTEAARFCLNERSDCLIPRNIVDEASHRYADFMTDYEQYHLSPPAIPAAFILVST